MALTLNGTSNTIAGVAVGGLPDGTVDEDMIAAKAVTAAKRGAGAILQITSGSSSTMAQEPDNNSTWKDVTPTASITPSSTSNKILVIPSVATNVYAADYFGFKLQRTISSTTTNLREWWGHDGDSTYTAAVGPQIHLDSPNTTSAVTYGYMIYANDNYTHMQWNYNGETSDNSLIKAEVYLIEIAG